MDFPIELFIWTLIVAIVWLLNILIIAEIKRRRKEKLERLPTIIICQVKCDKCGFQARKEWERGDFMMKEIVFKHFANAVTKRKLDKKKQQLDITIERKLCTGKVIIDGIYVICPPLSKAELKYKELCDKWR